MKVQNAVKGQRRPNWAPRSGPFPLCSQRDYLHSGVIGGSWAHSRHPLMWRPSVNKKREGRAEGPKRLKRREDREELWVLGPVFDFSSGAHVACSAQVWGATCAGKHSVKKTTANRTLRCRQVWQQSPPEGKEQGHPPFQTGRLGDWCSRCGAPGSPAGECSFHWYGSYWGWYWIFLSHSEQEKETSYYSISCPRSSVPDKTQAIIKIVISSQVE